MIWQRRWRWIRSQRGIISITELITAAALLVMVLGATYLIYESGLEVGDTVEQQAQAESVTRSGLNHMARNIRECVGITSAGDYTITLRTDYDHNGTSDTLCYYVFNGTLYYTVNGGTARRLSDDVVNSTRHQSIFTYIDYKGDSISLESSRLALTYQVRLTLISDKKPNDSREGITVETQVKLRNRH